MQHRMTVWTDRSQISNGVEHILTTNRCQRYEVVYVYESMAEIFIDLTEIELTDLTRHAPMGDAGASRRGIALIDVDDNRLFGTLDDPARLAKFLRQEFRVRIFFLRERPRDAYGITVSTRRALARPA
jgi:hypothetical protein